MKVTIDFGDELAPMLQAHLDGGPSVSRQIRAAVRYFNEMLHAEATGNTCGWGDKSRFKQYNHELSPGATLQELY